MSVPEAAGSGWTWPKDMVPETSASEQPLPPQIFKNSGPEPPVLEEASLPGIFKEGPESRESPVKEEHTQEQDHATPPPKRTHYKPRQCRICLEEVLPSFEPASEGIGAFLNPSPKVSYISSDPESGRLIRPCKCRGSQAYVHEGCLQAWRHADPRYGERNFWECPTCKFKYRLERMKWSRFITSAVAQIGITTLIMLTTVFLLGFIADPIINLYFEPGATIASVATGNGLAPLELEDELAEYDGWIMHFMKGLTSIGVLGFVKVIWAVSPITWWNIRGGGLFGGGGRNGRVRAGVTGRDRADTTFWILVIVGVVTFLYTIWTWVRTWTRRTLEKASERVVDVHGLEDDDEEEDIQQEPAPNGHTEAEPSSDPETEFRKRQ